MIVIVDYGMGNLRSVSKALESLGAPVCLSSDARDVQMAAKLILPGVGAFPAAVQELTARRLIEPLRAAIASGTPYLGICLGLQLLFERSEEGAGAGLGVLQGAVKQFTAPRLKVPHMGWNQIVRPPRPAGQDPCRGGQTSDFRRQSECPLLKGIPEGSFFYFVHSYYAQPVDERLVTLEADYGGRFAAMVCRGNIHATQFHPEKSQVMGLRLLENFLKL